MVSSDLKKALISALKADGISHIWLNYLLLGNILLGELTLFNLLTF